MIEMIVLIVTVLLILACCLFIGIATLLTGSLKTTLFIIKNSFKVCFINRERKKFIDNAYTILNTAFKKVCQNIVEKKDEELSEILKVDIQDAKKFKIAVNKLLKEEKFEFLTYDEINETIKEEKVLNPLLMIRNIVLTCADPAYINAINIDGVNSTQRKSKFDKIKEKLLRADEINIKNDASFMYSKLFA